MRSGPRARRILREVPVFQNRRPRGPRIALVLFLLSALSAPAGAGVAPESFSDLAEAAGPAVVNIRTEKTVGEDARPSLPFGREEAFDFFERFFGERPDRDFTERSLGSGFLVAPEGFIVTNNHVVEGADRIRVQLDGGAEYDAEIAGRDPGTDLALVRIRPDGDLPFLELGNSDALRVGQWVLAIGNPYGLEHTVTAGIVSAKGRVIGSGPYDDFIQTDASINPGNSGGPLLDMDGRVVGINTAIVASGQGIGFAVPIDMARSIIRQLRESGEVTRGWLGVAIQDLTPELAEYYGMDRKEGVLVTRAFPGDPAAEAGLRPRDIIVGVNDAPVEKTHDLTRIVAAIEVGAEARIDFLRDGERKTATATVARRDEKRIAAGMRPEAEPSAGGALGIEAAELDEETAARLDLAPGAGVLVIDVAEDSPAARAGVTPGDLVKEVDRRPVSTVAEFEAAVAGIPEGEPARLFIRRPEIGFLVVRIER
jgi:serine protease Do